MVQIRPTLQADSTFSACFVVQSSGMSAPDGNSMASDQEVPFRVGPGRVLFRFGRPHTIIATTAQAAGIFILAVAGAPLTAQALWLLAIAWLGSLLTNLYVVGLNQLTDVDIDKVNKPSLPLASGDLSARWGKWIVAIAGTSALFIGATQSLALFLTFAVIMAIGTLYSLRPTRLKERPFWAALSIAFARGFMANAGLYLNYTGQLDIPVDTGTMAWVLLFFFGFGLVIALYKDIPDTEGDQTYNVRTYSVRLGQQRVFAAGRWLLTAIFLVPIAAGVIRLPGLDGVILVVAHVLLIALFWVLSGRTDPGNPASIMRLYLALWAIFYSEYLVLALAAVAGSGL